MWTLFKDLQDLNLSLKTKDFTYIMCYTLRVHSKDRDEEYYICGLLSMNFIHPFLKNKLAFQCFRYIVL